MFHVFESRKYLNRNLELHRFLWGKFNFLPWEFKTVEILQLDFGFKISLLFSATKGHLYLLVGQNVSEISAKKRFPLSTIYRL